MKHEQIEDVPATSHSIPQAKFSHVFDDGRQLDRLNAEGGVAVTFRPTAKDRPHLSFRGSQSASWSIWQTQSRTGFISSPAIAADLLTIRFVLDGRMIRRDRSEDHLARRGHAMLVVFERMRDEEASPLFEAISATISRTALLDASQKLHGERASALPDFAPVVEVDSPPMIALLQTLRAIHARVTESALDLDLVLPLVREIAAYQVLTAWPRIGPERSDRAGSVGTRTVRRARDHIEAHLSRKLLLADVARAAGIGVRSLQVAFRKELGVSPSEFILGQRLERVRMDLRAASERGVTIRAIAERWGFTHMSDFGRRYRERFGEPPNVSRSVRG